MALATAVVTFLAAGCATHQSPNPEGTRPHRTPTASDTEIAYHAVEFAYQEFWIILGLLDEQPANHWHGILAAVAVEPELSRQLANATDRRNRGVHLRGEPTIHITAIHGALGVTATLTDCQDAT